MIAPRLQRILLCFLFAGAFTAAAQLEKGSIARLEFRDVDGNDHATAKGYVSIITVVTREKETQARVVGDRVPERCVGDLRYHYLTVLNFQRRIAGPLQGLTRTVIRNRLGEEAERLKAVYAQKTISREPREDLFVVADFDGSAVTQLGLTPESDEIGVFVFSGEGKLIAHWHDVPEKEALAKAISAAE